MMDSRRYIRRQWRVPKDQGPATYLAALVVKAMTKHGWPARLEWVSGHSFSVQQVGREEPATDFLEALEIAVRIQARTHGLDVEQCCERVTLCRDYKVVKGGFFREVKK